MCVFLYFVHYLVVVIGHLRRLRTVPTTKEVFFARLMTMREKQILARAIGIQKENWGEPRIFQR